MLHLMLAREIVREIERAIEDDLRRRQLVADARAAAVRTPPSDTIRSSRAVSPAPSAGPAPQRGRPARAGG